MKSELVIHTLDPVFDSNSWVLVLGTMPSPKSREQHFYYANPRNRFWRVMERLFSLEDQALSENKARCEFCLHITLRFGMYCTHARLLVPLMPVLLTHNQMTLCALSRKRQLRTFLQQERLRTISIESYVSSRWA